MDSKHKEEFEFESLREFLVLHSSNKRVIVSMIIIWIFISLYKYIYINKDIFKVKHYVLSINKIKVDHTAWNLKVKESEDEQ